MCCGCSRGRRPLWCEARKSEKNRCIESNSVRAGRIAALIRECSLVQMLADTEKVPGRARDRLLLLDVRPVSRSEGQRSWLP